MNDQDFEVLRTTLLNRSGLSISQEKMYLVETRLLPIAQKKGLSSVEELIHEISRNRDADVVTEVVEAMATHETFFFRDRTPFDNFTDVILPDLLQKRAAGRRIRIWCAACSSGQEPYSLAMLLRDRQKELDGWSVEIVATDMSNAIVEKAMAGEYNHFEVQRGLPSRYLQRDFVQDGKRWAVAEPLRQNVGFQVCNLLDDLTPLGRFDAVFCRNVLIYFDVETKIDVLGRIRSVMADDGYLLLGAAETTVGLSKRFGPVAESRGLYRPIEAIGAEDAA